MTTTLAPPPPALEAEDAVASSPPAAALVVYLLLGVFFGVLLIKSEVVSWYRIQEMFRFQSFHMYGVLGSGVAVAAASLYLIRRLGLRSLAGETISVPRKERGRRYLYGGTAFGLGWGLTGACPGPILALIGFGVTPFLVVFGSALAGTWAYGQLRPRLPH